MLCIAKLSKMVYFFIRRLAPIGVMKVNAKDLKKQFQSVSPIIDSVKF